MEKSFKRRAAVHTDLSNAPLRSKLMLAASAGIIALVAPGGLYGTRAEAQALPTGCEDTNVNDPTGALPATDDGNFDNGETVSCVQDYMQAVIDPIDSTVSNASLIIGDGTIETRVSAPPPATGNRQTPAISLDGTGHQSLTINAGSQVQTPADGIIGVPYGGIYDNNGQAVYLKTTDGNLTLTNSGAINAGDYDPDDFYAADNAVRANIVGGNGDLKITSTGSITGTVSAVSNSTGIIDVDIAKLAEGPLGVNGQANVNGVKVTLGEVYGNRARLAEIINDGQTLDLANNPAAGQTLVTLNGPITRRGLIDAPIIEVRNGANTTDQIITASGKITSLPNESMGITTGGGGAAIASRHDGTGKTDITVTDISAVRGTSIDAKTAASTSELNITVNGAVDTGQESILAEHSGRQGASITLGKNGSIISNGITDSYNSFYAYDAVSLITKADGVGSTIQGYVDQPTSKLYGSISGSAKGIKDVTNNGDIVIEDMANVSGGTEQGIYARSTGGTITIQNIDSVTSEGSWAIDADSRLAETRQDMNGADYTVYSGGNDVSIQNVSVPEFNDGNTMNARSANGIRAFSGTGSINIGADNTNPNSAIGDIFTTGTGILTNSESGSTTIRTQGAITAGARGISATQNGAGKVSITTDGAINSDEDGINVDHNGTGDVEIVSNQTITSGLVANRGGTNEGDGIQVSADQGNIKITANAAIDAQRGGIRTQTFQSGSTGTTSIYVNAQVQGYETGLAIDHARGGLASVHLGVHGALIGTINNGANISSDYDGARVLLEGTSTGKIQGEYLGAGLYTENGAITVQNLSSVSGNQEQGILARSTGGTITVQNIDSVTSTGSWAIEADTREFTGTFDSTSGGYIYAGGGADISIQNVGIPGFNDANNNRVRSANGIRAFSGTGNINIGTVVNTKPILVQGTGILAESEGGNIAIHTDGRVVAGTGPSLSATTSGAGTINLSTKQGAYTSGASNILATSTGTGKIDVSLIGFHEGGGAGVDIRRTAAVDTVPVGDMTLTLGARTIIDANDVGASLLDLSTSVLNMGEGAGGNITVKGMTGPSGSSISGGTLGLLADTTGGDIHISDFYEISGGSTIASSGPPEGGLRAISRGGEITIENIDTVTSNLRSAVIADTRKPTMPGMFEGGADISIQNIAVEKISAHNDANIRDTYSADGIFALSGTGNINIGAEDPAMGTGIGNIYSDGTGLHARTDGGSVDILVDGQIVTRGSHGIDAAIGGMTAANMTIGVNNKIDANSTGIYGRNAGSGTTTLTLGEFGEITGQSNDGVNLANSGDGAKIMVEGFVDPMDSTRIMGSVSGASDGLYLSTVEGDITVQNLASVQGNGHGIRAQSRGGSITIRDIASVVGNYPAAIWTNSGSGQITIENVAIPRIGSANVSHGGIRADSGGGKIAISGNSEKTAIGEINTSKYGIRAYSSGGDIGINVDGAINVADGPGIYTQANGGDITISVSDVTVRGGRGEVAIDTYTYYNGTTSITVEGRVAAYSSDGIGIVTKSQAGSAVTVAENGSVYGSLATAIEFKGSSDGAGGTFSTDDTLTLNGVIESDVLMGTGNDTFNFGGRIDRTRHNATVFGGDDDDTVNITSMTAETLTNSGGTNDSIQEFETINFNGDNFTLDGMHSGWNNANFNLGTTILAENATLEAATGIIAMNAVLNARDGSIFTGDLTNNGTLNIGSSPGLFTINGNFTQGSDGILPIEFEGTAYDQLIVTGDVTLGGELRVSVLNGMSPSTSQPFAIISGNSISGTFGEITDLIPDLDFAADYDPTEVVLNFVAASPPPPPPPAPPPPPPPPPPPGPDPMPDPDPDPTPDPDPDPMPDPDPDPDPDPTPEPGGEDPVDPVEPVTPEVPLLSPKEIVPSALMAGMFADDLFADSLLQRRSERMKEGDWSFWTAALGGQYNVGNSDTQLGWEGGTTGFSFGAQHLFDHRGTPILFGLSTAFSEADLDSSVSHGKVDSVHLGGFVNAELGALFVAGSATHAWQDYDIQRVFVVQNGPAVALSETEGKASSFKTEAYYDLLWSDGAEQGLGFGPVLTADLSTGTINRFKETGTGILNLTYETETAQQTVIGAGAEAHYAATLFGDTVIDTGFRVLVENVSGDRAISGWASLEVDGAVFEPSTSDLDKNRVAAGADAKVYFSDRIYGHIRYDTTRGENFTEHEGWAGVTLRF